MLIKDMFRKPIDRNIQGVIVVGEDGLNDEKNELEEYVVTRELQRHFKEFYENYKQGIIGKTRKNGVWISGFFGSGKSHFLKMLSYLLENKLVSGKRTLDYFKEDNKIQDAMVMADIQLAVDTPTKVILFNIDSKSEQTSKQSKDAIVNVFLKVFNDMLGFYGARPAIADLERALTEDGCYAAFEDAFFAVSGHAWKEYRHRFNYELMHVAQALVDIQYQNMSMDAATALCKQIMLTPYQISIEDFARMVRAWCDKMGNNQHIIFCVDEVGQYIGDDSQMMLNLQTMREELGKECQGRAWVIVTSQQDVDSIMEMTARKGTDFSKIQGRFDTRLSLSSANVDEVIKKRLLDKTEPAEQTLRLLYDEKKVSIKNKIKFDKTPEMKLYESRENFAEIYPFIPYQFNLLGKVLNSIRTHGASGKHLSEGERSMLALFKKAAERLQNKNDGALVPFYMFYDALENFLDSVHSRVISQALDNKNINPAGEADCFAVNVLKVLFLVKYVKEFQATTIPNITSLMVDNVDEDTYELQQRVEAALKVLVKETLVQEHSGNYVFLTEEEQEIGREIERQNVETGEIQNKISDLIFNDLYAEAKYKYNSFNGRYTFWFNQLVDNRPHKNNQNYDIGEELNRIFIDIYGLQDELTPEVEDKDVTVRKADLQRDIKSLLSYAVGCIFGRYSLDVEGLAYAGGEFSDQWVVISDQCYRREVVEKYVAQELQRAYGMAEVNVTDGRDLSFSKVIAERGVIFTFGSDEKSSSVDSIKYRRGTSKKLYEGICELSFNSERIKCGIGNATYDLCSPEILNAITSGSSVELVQRGWQDADSIDWQTIHYTLKTNHYGADEDNVIPITDEDYFEDDIIGRLITWLKVVYGAETLEENLRFIADALGTSGDTARQKIRNYFLKDFFKDHCKIYQKRPIYWLYDSGKQNGFKALIYMHRYNADTSGQVRAEYLGKMEETYESEINRMQDIMDNGAGREVALAGKRKEKLQKQLHECRDYDAVLGHIALASIAIDLDDGVKVNYVKVQTAKDGKLLPILAKI